MLLASHTFNLLDARQAISVSERQRFILRVRTMARAVRTRGAVDPVFVENLDDLADVLNDVLADGDLVLTMGAGDIANGGGEADGKVDLLTFFTAGKREVRAWTVREGSTAAQSAGKIHTDFERGFIRAEVISYDDFVALGGEAGAKEAGKLRLEGKSYVVREGDVMHFRFNV